MHRHLALVLIALLLGVLGTATAADASIPGPDGVIHACYTTGPGVLAPLSVIDSSATCPGSANPLTWSVAGPAAPPAQTAVPAVQIQPFDIDIRGNGVTAAGHGLTRTFVLRLPLGSWAISAHVVIVGDGSCGLVNADNVSLDSSMYVGNGVPGISQVPLVGTITETTGDELSLSCWSYDPTRLFVNVTSVVAVAVSSITSETIPTKVPSVPVDPNHVTPDVPLAPSLHAHLVNIFYAPSSSPHHRQQAQIALLAGEGDTVEQISHETFATPAQIRAVILHYHGKLVVTPH